MSNRMVFAVSSLVFLAACADSPVQPAMIKNPVSLLASKSQDQVDVCHVNEEGQIRPITVAAPAVAAHLAHGDALAGVVLPAGSSFSASRSWLTDPPQTPDRAFDGDPLSAWNAGAHPTQYIEVDFGSPQRFSVITALVVQLPNGTTNHDVSLDGVAAFSWFGFTSHEDLLSHTFATMQTAQKVRITTTLSPSWVAWLEIQIRGC